MSKRTKTSDVMVTVRCYNEEEKLTKAEALKKYKEGFECSDGSERERYMEILSDLMDGKDYCDDKVY